MKVDLLCWSKFGIPSIVLNRISSVVPDGNVHQKILVCDAKSDLRDYSFEKYGWQLILNEGEHISGAANTGLKHIESSFFVTFEDDLLLDRSWWNQIPPLFKDSKVVVASGIRFASQPLYLQSLQKYVYRKYLSGSLPGWLRHREMAAFTLGKTLDNTLWRTSFMRDINGFPHTESNTGVDPILAYRVLAEGYKWIVDYNVQSVHLRTGGLQQELQHQVWYGTGAHEIWREIKRLGAIPPITFWGLLYRTLFSSLTGAFMAWKTRQPFIFVAHPLLKLANFKGFLNSKQFVRTQK